MTTSRPGPRPLPMRVRLSGRSQSTSCRVLGLAAALVAGLGLTACATGPSFFDRGGLSDASDTAWEGAAKPRPVAMSSAAPVRVGSQPLLPPVPEETSGLPPIKVTAYAD